jgi:predicted PurR-regulated permease PerM
MRSVHAQRLLVFLVLAAVALTVILVRPFWVALFLGAVFAATLRPAMEWLTRQFRGRRQPAAALLTLGVLLAVVLPLAGLGAALVREVLNGIQWLREALASEGVWGLIQRLPGPAEELAGRILEAIPEPEEVLRQLASQGGQAAAAVGGVLAATGSAVFQTVMFLIALFFFLVDGGRFVTWIDAQVPLRPGQFRALLEDFRKTSGSVLVATLATAGIQTATALVGYLIARAPNPLFLGILTFVIALVPALGGAFMVVATGILLFATGHPIAGGFLVIWGAAVVSLVDNVARPYLLKGGMQLHGGVVFFALLGGLAVFGGVGLLIGPLVVTFLIAALRLYRREFGSPGEAGGEGEQPGL